MDNACASILYRLHMQVKDSVHMQGRESCLNMQGDDEPAKAGTMSREMRAILNHLAILGFSWGSLCGY